MVDINYIRKNPEEFKKAIQDKKVDLDFDHLIAVDDQRRELIQKIEDINRQRNIASQNRDVEEGRRLKTELETLEPELEKIKQEFDVLMVKVPTIPAPDTPPGESEVDNVEVFTWGEKPTFDFKPLDHIELAKKLDIIDFDRGAKVAGYRGYYLKNEGVMLEMALMMYVLKKAVDKGYKPMIPPTLVKGFALFGSGYFKGTEYDDENDEIYQIASTDKDESGTKSKDKRFLVGTAEPSLLAYYSGETLKEKDLPVRICGFSQCYRSEIGSYGRDTKGLYRVHEFFKVELVVLSPASIEESDLLQQEMIDFSKEIHEELGLPFRVLRICMGDLSAGKYKQFDLEAWMPGLDRWGETGSASNFLDWQSRRLDVKYEDVDGKNKKPVYMLNNTALPTPRPIIAILENFQQEDGTVIVPEPLRIYTGFEKISPKKAA